MNSFFCCCCFSDIDIKTLLLLEFIEEWKSSGFQVFFFFKISILLFWVIDLMLRERGMLFKGLMTDQKKGQFAYP